MFLFWDLVIDNIYVSVFLTLIIDWGLVFLRNLLGKRKLSKTALIPEMFLL